MLFVKWVGLTRSLLIGIFVGGLSPHSWALNCIGQITYLGLDQHGGVTVAAGTNINTICSTTSQGSYLIDTATCKLFYGTLLAHRIAGKQVRIYYDDPSLTSCSQIQAWSSQPSVYFVESSD